MQYLARSYWNTSNTLDYPLLELLDMSSPVTCLLVLVVTTVVLARAGTLERRGASRDIYPDHNSATGSEGRQHRMVSDGDADWSHSSGELTDCPGCARQVSAGALRETLSPEEFRTVMIELVKIKLLKKLNLKQPPVLNGTRVLPAPLIPNLNNVMQSDDHRTRLHRVASHTGQRLGRPDRTISRRSQTNDKREGTTLEKIALIGEEEYHHDDEYLSSSRHFAFNIRENVFRYVVRSAALWLAPEDGHVNVTDTRTLYISDANRHHRKTVELSGVPGHILAKDKLRAGQGKWMTFDVTDAVRNWVKRRRGRNRLTVTCIGCGANDGKLQNVPIRTDAEFRPFLVIETKKKTSRTRRNANYHGVLGGCFLEELYINFTEIGWHTWIRQPEGYKANFCNGSCVNHDVLLSYSRVMMDVIKSKPRNTNYEALLAPCCAAVETSSISILYEVDPNQYIYEKLDNMVADACDCR